MCLYSKFVVAAATLLVTARSFKIIKVPERIYDRKPQTVAHRRR